MKKSNKLKSLKQTHGKLEVTDTPRVANPTTLAQLWGDMGTDKYRTMDIGVYEAELASMNLGDLQNHAVVVGFAPGDNRKNLITKLRNEFIKHVSAYNVPRIVQNQGKSGKSLKETLDILSEGR